MKRPRTHGFTTWAPALRGRPEPRASTAPTSAATGRAHFLDERSQAKKALVHGEDLSVTGPLLT
jgi:hypothetical protein